MFGMSWPREMRPAPIAPTLIRLPGDALPKTVAGTIAGNPAATVVTAAALPADAKNSRRECFLAMVSDLQCQPLRLGLRLQRELHREERVRLRHRGFRPVDDVRHEPRPERQIAVLAVDVACLLLIDDEQMVAAGTAADVDILSQLDVALGAEDRQPSVAPRRQAVGSEPVQPDVARAAVAAEHHVAEVLELGPVLVRHVAGLRRDDVGLRRARVEEELIDLVRPDVDENPA